MPYLRYILSLFFSSCGLIFISCQSHAHAQVSDFRLITEPDRFIIHTGSDLTFAIQRAPREHTHHGMGDLISLRYHGIDYQEPLKGSQINSGFSGLYDDTNTVSVDASIKAQDFICITVRSGALIHTYIAHRGEAALYMTTWFSAEPKLGLVRYVMRVPYSRLPHGPPEADLNDTDHTVEAHDVFGLPNGETRSKHYSNHRLKDWSSFGASNAATGLWMVRDTNEGNSGGPFYRSLLDQGTTHDQELTYVINYGEGQTEAFRTHILNSYALVFSKRPPTQLHMPWLGLLNLHGYRSPNDRGTLEGTVPTQLDPHFRYTVALSGPTGQYWCDPSPRTKQFRCTMVSPGRYHVTLYKNELSIAEQDTLITPHHPTNLPPFVTHDPERERAIWRIGHWDGSPQEFRNGTTLTLMHPSDSRMKTWTIPTFIIGHNTVQDFPAYQWKDINNALPIRFRLSAPLVEDLILRVGVTTAFMKGRPTIQLNQWRSDIPAPSRQPSSRTLTVGTYRGNNTCFRFRIPAHAFKAGENTLTLSVAEGSTSRGFLSPSVSYDAIDLLQPNSP